jgi:Fic family protein
MPLQDELEGLVNDFPPELFQRASDYLYIKETRSTYGIEREAMPPVDRAQRFVALLRSAGEEALQTLLSEAELVKRQNLIVDPRYAMPSFRPEQNYVGEQRPDYSQRIHYACPPPQFVGSLMAGLADSAERCTGLPAIARAAAVAFGFVFIHPFEDGNGRLHRFLIHDILHRDGLVGRGIMLPVSATMLRRMVDYDASLEHYSRPLMEGWVSYDLDQEGKMMVTNPDQIEGYYRFPDLTTQVEYLAATVALSIREDFTEELRFLRSFDAARQSIREIIDMPDRRLDLLLRLLHQNGGLLSQAKREQFAEILDEELERIEKSFSASFGNGL